MSPSKAYISDRNSKVKKVFLPDADTKDAKGVLDLASGEMLAFVNNPDKLSYYQGIAKGDLAYDHSTLICLRGAKAYIWQNDSFLTLTPAVLIQDATIYEFPEIPCNLQVTTAEGARFDVRILNITKEGINIRYQNAEAPKQYIAHLPNDVTVELLGYSNWENDQLQWWSPNGSRINIPGVYEADVDGLGTVIICKITTPDPKDVIRLSASSLSLGNTRSVDYYHCGGNTWLFSLKEDRRYVSLRLKIFCIGPGQEMPIFFSEQLFYPDHQQSGIVMFKNICLIPNRKSEIKIEIPSIKKKEATEIEN